MSNKKTDLLYVLGCLMFLVGMISAVYSVAIYSQGLLLMSAVSMIVGFSITNAIEYRNDPCSFWQRLSKKFKRKKSAQIINPAGRLQSDLK